MKCSVTMCQKKKKLKNRDILCLTKRGKRTQKIITQELSRDCSLTICFIQIYSNEINSTVIVKQGYHLHSPEFNSSIIVSKLRLTEKMHSSQTYAWAILASWLNINSLRCFREQKELKHNAEKWHGEHIMPKGLMTGESVCLQQYHNILL